jgi:hypothetical protein
MKPATHIRRHAREGGHPRQVTVIYDGAMCELAWIPACAGMTFLVDIQR